MKIGVVSVPFISSDIQMIELRNSLAGFMSDTHEINHYGLVTKCREKDKEELSKLYNSLVYQEVNILAKAWNDGINQALKGGCSYVFVANTDIIVPPDLVDNMVKFAERAHHAVIWSPKCASQTDFKQRNTVDYVDMYDHYALFMVNDRLFELVGKFDEQCIPAYGEDQDMQIRIQRVGLAHMCNPNCEYYHFHSSSTWNAENLLEAIENLDGYSRQHMVDKWGGERENAIYDYPFNRKAPQIGEEVTSDGGVFDERWTLVDPSQIETLVIVDANDKNIPHGQQT